GAQNDAGVAMTSAPDMPGSKRWYDANGLVRDHRTSPMFSARLTLMRAGQEWALDLVSTTAFEAAYHKRKPTSVLMIGAAATFVLTLVAWFFDSSRRRALSESDRRFRKMADATPSPFGCSTPSSNALTPIVPMF